MRVCVALHVGRVRTCAFFFLSPGWRSVLFARSVPPPAGTPPASCCHLKTQTRRKRGKKITNKKLSGCLDGGRSHSCNESAFFIKTKKNKWIIESPPHTHFMIYTCLWRDSHVGFFFSPIITTTFGLLDFIGGKEALKKKKKIGTCSCKLLLFTLTPHSPHHHPSPPNSQLWTDCWVCFLSCRPVTSSLSSRHPHQLKHKLLSEGKNNCVDMSCLQNCSPS